MEENMSKSRPKEFRPSILKINSLTEFEKWYWPVSEMTMFCKAKKIPYSGLKADLRKRIINYFSGSELVAEVKKKRSSWGTKTLSLSTIIDSDVSFGCNTREFFKKHIGSQFVCSAPFMDWVKENQGATLSDAIAFWYQHKSIEKTPGHRREIALCNNYLQYLRDLKDDNPSSSANDAKNCWKIKSRLPAHGGYIKYEKDDLQLLHTCKDLLEKNDG